MHSDTHFTPSNVLQIHVYIDERVNNLDGWVVTPSEKGLKKTMEGTLCKLKISLGNINIRHIQYKTITEYCNFRETLIYIF